MSVGPGGGARTGVCSGAWPELRGRGLVQGQSRGVARAQGEVWSGAELRGVARSGVELEPGMGLGLRSMTYSIVGLRAPAD